ncbi:hypothetical protein N7457_005538 [Penicillium paradoxum]|uniref:uncharacterized protein n=1 Tax=Penicillium paradoxum TaxID=176176 RepID=UPI00254959EE|nr:uncharacterized protein N7457_005538 [Penicillium paradoxum]KAJ5780378.1 hypothetical protein N7457_005538 [Penicillium paradoxum]
MAMDTKEIQEKGKILAKVVARDAPRIAAREAAKAKAEPAAKAAKEAGLPVPELKYEKMPADEANMVQGVLKEIQQGIRATEDLLRQTRIGIIVNKLKISTSEDVGRLASAIVKKWRDDVQKPKHGATSAASRALSGSPRPVKKDTSASTPAAATPSDKAPPKPTGPVKDRTWTTDGVDINHTDNGNRNKSMGLIYNGLCAKSTEDPKVILPRAIAVEIAAYKLVGPETKAEYRDKIRSLFMNLKNKSNPKLSVRVIEGEITGEQLVRMSSDELRSIEQREADAKIRKENMDKAMVAQQERSISKSLQCGKCGQRQVTYTEAQTRAADEPMTLFCTCLACGKSWRQ